MESRKLMIIDGRKELFGCNAAVVSGISSSYGGAMPPEKMVKTIVTHKSKFAFYAFADAQKEDPKETYMIKFKEYVEKHDLGPLLETEGWHYNEAHGPRYIKIYVWRPAFDSESMKNWLEKNKTTKTLNDSPW
jgi:hypothetical protein